MGRSGCYASLQGLCAVLVQGCGDPIGAKVDSNLHTHFTVTVVATATLQFCSFHMHMRVCFTCAFSSYSEIAGRTFGGRFEYATPGVEIGKKV